MLEWKGVNAFAEAGHLFIEFHAKSLVACIRARARFFCFLHAFHQFVTVCTVCFCSLLIVRTESSFRMCAVSDDGLEKRVHCTMHRKPFCMAYHLLSFSPKINQQKKNKNGCLWLNEAYKWLFPVNLSISVGICTFLSSSSSVSGRIDRACVNKSENNQMCNSMCVCVKEF